MLNYLLFYGFLYSLLSLVFPSKKKKPEDIDIIFEGDLNHLKGSEIDITIKDKYIDFIFDIPNVIDVEIEEN